MISVTVVDPFDHQQVEYLNPLHIISVRQGVDEATIRLTDGSVVRVKDKAAEVADMVSEYQNKVS